MYPFIPNIEPAWGQELENLASIHGVVRKPNETDEELRRRVKSYMSGDTMPEQKAPVCECGAHKLGFKERGPGHSDWCPFFVPPVI